MKNNYYRRRSIYYRLIFRFIEFTLSKEIDANLGKKVSREVIVEIRRTFKKELTELPYIGGKKNFLTIYLVGGAWVYSLFLALKKVGIENEQAGDILYQVTTKSLNKLPKFLRIWLSRFYLSTFNKNIFRKLDVFTAKKEYPENWVLKYVEGKDNDFVFGVDYTECALCKYFKTKGIENYSKYVCVFDYAFFSTLPEMKFTRTQTLAEGKTVCNFRFGKK